MRIDIFPGLSSLWPIMLSAAKLFPQCVPRVPDSLCGFGGNAVFAKSCLLSTVQPIAWGRNRLHVRRKAFFLLRLPFGQGDSASKFGAIRNKTLNCTGPLNWGEAHCAGEKVKRKKDHLPIESPGNKNWKQTAKHGRSAPRNPGTPRPGAQRHGSRKTEVRQR